jgi:hypothetical protein
MKISFKMSTRSERRNREKTSVIENKRSEVGVTPGLGLIITNFQFYSNERSATLKQNTPKLSNLKLMMISCVTNRRDSLHFGANKKPRKIETRRGLGGF